MFQQHATQHTTQHTAQHPTQHTAQPPAQHATLQGSGQSSVKLVLALDGGGVRGLATAQFLNRLEAELGRPLHEVFDLVAGTSIGSIIAASIGCKKAAMSSAMSVFDNDTIKSIFDASLSDKVLGIAQPKPKYSGKGKTHFLQTYFGDLLLSGNRTQGGPIVMMTSYDVVKREFQLFSSHAQDGKYGNIPVCQTCDASSAAPAYFPAVKFSQTKDYFIDGGVVANNPSIVAYSEAIGYFGNATQIYMVSVGTGSQTRPIDGKKAQGWGGVQWLAHGLLDIAMDETVVEKQAAMLLGVGASGGQERLVRINSDLNEANDDMDDTSADNLKALTSLGDQWWEQFGARTVALIRAAGK
eukprot:TRINITY_DN4717_c0_g1_i1.p1 TRINITY_DN4717_c0_g1~~TRINITY_DN4717_c0_g1_i1.p1  ORF type:complete len:385 (-),score=71.05 TRINITY_DN4717_c0_g1_i1:67-1131(-)